MDLRSAPVGDGFQIEPSPSTWKAMSEDTVLSGPTVSNGPGNVPSGGDLSLNIGWARGLAARRRCSTSPERGWSRATDGRSLNSIRGWSRTYHHSSGSSSPPSSPRCPRGARASDFDERVR